MNLDDAPAVTYAIPGYRLAYDAAQRDFAHQQQSLDELRTRVAVLLSAGGIAASFFGAQVLRNGDLDAATVVALSGFAAIGALSVMILWPSRNWALGLSATEIIRTYVDSPEGALPLDRVQRDLALHLENVADGNAQTVERLSWYFRGAAIAFALEIAGWILALGTA